MGAEVDDAARQQFKIDDICFVISQATSSSAIAERPRDALSQLKSCQLLHNCTKNHI